MAIKHQAAFYFNGWAKIKGGARYAGVGDRTFRGWLKCGLRHVRLPSGTILIKYEWVDEFLTQYEAKTDSVDQITDEVLKDFAL